ncbi:glycosyltransferase family 2 protein [Nocardia heshunensis]
MTPDDLPIARAEIELSAPAPEFVLADEQRTARKILALVRWHAAPVGVVVLDAERGRDWETRAPTVRNAVAEAVSEHLRSDNPDAAAEIGPACVRRRRRMLAHAPAITVVVATRGRPESLRRCLEALLRLDYPRYEIVVVDNDPPDDATATMIAERFGDRVRYVREDVRGLAAAHNHGLAIADGRIVAFTDDDVIVDRLWLAGIAEGFDATPDVGCVTGLILPAELETPAQLLLEQHGGFDKGFTARIFDMDGHRPEDPLFPFTAGRFGSGANMAFDTAVLRGLGGFDPAIGIGTRARGGDDLAAFFRVVVGGHRLVYQPSALVWHHHHREMAALRNQVYGYGVGLGAYLTSALVHDPKMVGAFVRRLPRGVAYALAATSARREGDDTTGDSAWGLPAELAGLGRRGVLSGPAAYVISRWQTSRAAGVGR